LITRTILGEQYRSLSSSLCSFLHSLVISSLYGPNILNTLLSNTPAYVPPSMWATKFIRTTTGIIPLSNDGACLCLISSCSNFTVSLAQLSSNNVSSNSRLNTHNSGSSNVQSSATGHCNGHRKQSELCAVSTACYKCRRTAASGVHALETHHPDCQRQTCVFSSWLTSCGVYGDQDLALKRPWQNLTLERCDYSETFQPITDVTANLRIHEDVTPCHWVSSCRRFEGSYCLHLQIPANPLRLFDTGVRAVRAIETSGTKRTPKRRRRLQWHRCDNLQYRMSFILLKHQQLATQKHMYTWRVSAVDRTAIIWE
jgi:hypothetical protein